MDTRLYLRQFLILVSGTAAAQLVNLAGYPFLTRLYSPADFGVFALFITFAGVIGTVAAGRFDLIVQSGKNRELVPVYMLSQLINLAVSGTATVLFLVAAALGVGGMGPEHALLLGIAILFTGFCASSSLFLIRHEQYRVSTQSGVMRALMTVLPQILLFYLWPGPTSLILGFCIGFGAQAAMLGWGVSRYPLPRPTRLKLKAVWARHLGQVAVDVPGTLIGVLALYILNFFLLALFSTAEVGQYSLAFRVAVLPLSLFSASLSEVFFQKATGSFRRTGTFWNEVRFNLVSATALSVAVFVPMVLLARPVFVFMFGAEWRLAAEILIYLSPMLAIRFVSASLQSVPLVIRRPHWLFAHNVGLIAAMSAAFGLAEWLELSLKSYLLINSALMSVVYLSYILWIVTAVRRNYRLPSGSVAA
jgi:O-antigen/teichoic acid export membrane protein